MNLILIFIINGEGVPVSCNTDDYIGTARNLALSESHNTGRPPNEWEIRNEKGYLLDPELTIDDHGLKNGDKLFLTLQVGVGGDS